MFTDNRFTADSHVVHAERLLRMQQNFATYSSEFAPMNPEPLTWALTCYSDYQAKRVAVAHQDAQLKSATTASRLAFKAMHEEYIALRDYARQLFANDHRPFESYKLNMQYPSSRVLQLERISSILTESTKRAASQESVIVPTILTAKLTAAFEAAELGFQAQSTASNVINHARHARNEQRKIDIQNLKLLFSFASAIWHEDDVRFNDLGFARPDQTAPGGKNPLPNVPSGIHFNGSSTLEWAAVQGATSYGISTSDDGESWLTDGTTSTNSAIVRTKLYGKVFYRVRARNASGLGEYSATYERLFGLAAVKDFAYNRGELSWEEVEFATMYEVERAPIGTSTYIRIFTGSDTLAHDTPPQGTWTYRIRGVSGNVKGEWAEEAVVQA